MLNAGPGLKVNQSIVCLSFELIRGYGEVFCNALKVSKVER